jgi:hypothetical protein
VQFIVYDAVNLFSDSTQFIRIFRSLSVLAQLLETLSAFSQHKAALNWMI